MAARYDVMWCGAVGWGGSNHAAGLVGGLVGGCGLGSSCSVDLGSPSPKTQHPLLEKDWGGTKGQVCFTAISSNQGCA